jgi:hypothetical protein
MNPLPHDARHGQQHSGDEGIMHADRITWTGQERRFVLFAILKDEWPV